MYPTDIRATASGASALWFYIFAFLTNKSFKWMLETLHLYGLFILYGSVILIGSVFFFFFLPETEGFSLHEIEKHFSSQGNLFKTKIRHRVNTISNLPVSVVDLKPKPTSPYSESSL